MYYLIVTLRSDVRNLTRKLVIGLLVSLLVVSAGCAGIFADENTARDLKVVNQDETEHAIVVEISEKGSLVYSDGRTIDAESQLDLARFNQTGEYEMTITVDGNSTTMHHTFESDSDPIVVTNIGIDNQGQVTVE